MKTTILLTLFAFVAVYAQSDDALNIPVETDNQFPPDHVESDAIEGSGDGVLDEPNIDTTTASILLTDLENVDSTSLKQEAIDITPSASLLPCPSPCVCSIEGDSENFITDCSGYDLTEFPSGIDSRTTTLKLHNNKLTEIPKDVSNLKQLKVLNANNNQLMDIALGSVSELPELVTLKLANNRLIEYPKDLKNSIILIKLEELDLGGNDMRTTLEPETFSNFKALRQLTLPTTTTPELVFDLCASFKETLEIVCSESCTTASFECPDAPEPLPNVDEFLNATFPQIIALFRGPAEDNNDPTLVTEDKKTETDISEPQVQNNNDTKEPSSVLQSATDATLPGVIAFDMGSEDDNNDQTLNTENKITDPQTSEDLPTSNNPETTGQNADVPPAADPTVPVVIAINSETADTSLGNKMETPTSENPQASNNLDTTKQNGDPQVDTEFSLRSAVNKAPQEASNTIVESSNDGQDNKVVAPTTTADDSKTDQEDVKVGAKTVDTKTGGIDKSVIGIIVAGMIVVVAGITIKKNWSSIKKRFSSAPRPNERTGGNTNGVTPEEVPLKEKSPV